MDITRANSRQNVCTHLPALVGSEINDDIDWDFPVVGPRTSPGEKRERAAPSDSGSLSGCSMRDTAFTQAY